MTPTRIAVIGAGLIGRKHLGILKDDPAFEVAGIADPAPQAEAYARANGFPYFKDSEALLDKTKPDGVVIANPNALHRETALLCIARKIPAIVEKPVADTIADARAIVDAAAKANVPILTGHHRRHNPIMQAARDFVASGALGKVAAVNGTWLHRKPDDYFDVTWRREAGGGPILINAIHDIDCLRMVVGEIESVQATASNKTRSFAVEDTAAAVLTFANGALGTFIVSDATSSPWNWEATRAKARSRRASSRTASSSPAPAAASRSRNCNTGPTTSRTALGPIHSRAAPCRCATPIPTRASFTISPASSAARKSP